MNIQGVYYKFMEFNVVGDYIPDPGPVKALSARQGRFLFLRIFKYQYELYCKILFPINPYDHIEIGSRLKGFAARHMRSVLPVPYLKSGPTPRTARDHFATAISFVHRTLSS